MVRVGHVLAAAALLAPLLGPRASAADGSGRTAYPTSGFGHIDRSGLTEHAVNATVNGAVAGLLYGYALTSSTDEFSATRLATGAFLGATAGLVIALVRNPPSKEVRSGDIVFINVAHNVGFAHGAALPLLLGPRYGDWSSDYLRLTTALSATTGLVAGGLAAHYASEFDFTPGQASALGAAGAWGGFTGLALMALARPRNFGDAWGRATLGVTLLAADASLFAVWARRDLFDIDRGRIFVINIAGVVGAAAGLAAAYFVQPRLDDDRVLFGSLLAGSLTGIATGFLLTSGWDDYKKSVPPRGATGLSLLEYRGGKLSTGIPMPSATALLDGEGRARVRPLFSVASGSF